MHILWVNLICKFDAPDAVSALACASRIPTLHHKSLDISVKKRVVVVARGAQGQKVECSPWNGVAVDFDFDIAKVRVKCHRHDVPTPHSTSGEREGRKQSSSVQNVYVG